MSKVPGSGQVLANGDVLGETVAPRVVWSYWSTGFEQLSDFRRLCVKTWRSMNPKWEIVFLDPILVWDYIAHDDVPYQWEDMYVPFQADAVRLALLARFGGLWIDAATICVKPFDWWIYDIIRDSSRVEKIGVFYFSAWGVDDGKSAEYVENWVLASKRDHPMIVKWKQLFNEYWNSVAVGTLDPIGLPEHPMFHEIDITFLQRFGHDMRSYLVMHACFKKMIDEDLEMRKIWSEGMVLLRADDTALWHLNEADVKWNTTAALQKWLGNCEVDWLKHVLAHCPVLKFMKQFATLLDKQPQARYLEEAGFAKSSISQLFRLVLDFAPLD